jgi:chemotaxis signal transduction protein
MKTSTALIANTITPLESRFILAQVADRILAIPTGWVIEILRVDKIKILSLPFYQDLIVGITHYHGQVIPLLSTHHLIKQQPVNLREISTVVRLGDVAGKVTKVGLVVDRVIRIVVQSELPVAAVAFDRQTIPPNVWQPLH